ncbi:hypothetical protein QVD17_38618 [Tagetes erecta]|uniref:Uncharacterized protein n=1 Tax=Tagetes erecta TaxID=13708 RepID=A0AAD8JP76_TARER|nr:hypothetical protein QVD17_38618 [Tagetes erecta]
MKTKLLYSQCSYLSFCNRENLRFLESVIMLGVYRLDLENNTTTKSSQKNTSDNDIIMLLYVLFPLSIHTHNQFPNPNHSKPLIP